MRGGGRGPAAWKSSDVAWRGGRRPYDLGKEVIFQLIFVGLLVTVLAVVFASPNPPAATIKQWASEAPLDFARTTVQEIDGTSLTATYGPPYQPASEQNGSLQGFGFFSPQEWVGARIPIDTFTDLVATPLALAPAEDVSDALEQWSRASDDDQNQWAKAYREALRSATFSDTAIAVADGDYGPLPDIVEAQYRFALTGGLDAALLASDATTPDGYPVWYSNDQTRALMYLGDSGNGGADGGCIEPGQSVPDPDTCWWYNQAVANTEPRFGGYLDGDTWGVVNEVGNWPGAWWLVPYSSWYQWGYGENGASGDLWAMLMTGLVSLPFIFLPFIPGLRDIPRLTRVYRVMWGDYYRLVEREQRMTQRKKR